MRCYQEEKLSMSAIEQRFSCCNKKVFDAIHLYNKTKNFEPQPGSLEPEKPAAN